MATLLVNEVSDRFGQHLRIERAASLRPGGSAAPRALSSLGLGAGSKEESKEDAGRPGHRRRQAWGPGAGAGAAAALGAGDQASGWKVVLAPAGDEAQRTVPGGARLKEAFSVTNPAGGKAVELYLAPRGLDSAAAMTVHVHSSRAERRWSALTAATALNQGIAPGETISVFIENPEAILNFRLLDERGGLLETIDFTRSADPGQGLTGVLGVGI